MRDGKWSVKMADLLVAAAAGAGFGILNFALVFICGVLWNAVENKTVDGIRFYHNFSPLPHIHILAAALVVTLICGLVMGRYFSRKGYRREVVLLLGGLAGFVLALGPFSPSWIILWNSQDFLALDNFLKVFGFAAAGLGIGVPLAALSAYGYGRLTAGTRACPGKDILLTLAALGLAILIVMPPLAVEASFALGFMERTPDYYDIQWPISVERTAGDTIVVTNAGFHSAAARDLEGSLKAEMPFIIFINGKNATNAEAISESGLRANISPGSGLGLGAGDKVSFTGPDVGDVGNTSVVVVLNRADGTQMVNCALNR